MKSNAAAASAAAEEPKEETKAPQHTMVVDALQPAAPYPDRPNQTIAVDALQPNGAWGADACVARAVPARGGRVQGGAAEDPDCGRGMGELAGVFDRVPQDQLQQALVGFEVVQAWLEVELEPNTAGGAGCLTVRLGPVQQARQIDGLVGGGGRCG